MEEFMKYNSGIVGEWLNKGTITSRYMYSFLRVEYGNILWKKSMDNKVRTNHIYWRVKDMHFNRFEGVSKSFRTES
jgi:hypothetical protein